MDDASKSVCECGLSRSEVLRGGLHNSYGVCTTFKKGAERIECNELVIDHPRLTGMLLLLLIWSCFSIVVH